MIRFKKILAAVLATVILSTAAVSVNAAIPEDKIQMFNREFTHWVLPNPYPTYDCPLRTELYSYLWYTYATLQEKIPSESYEYINSAFLSANKDYKNPGTHSISKNGNSILIKSTYLGDVNSSIIDSSGIGDYYIGYIHSYHAAIVSKDTGELLRVGSLTENTNNNTFYMRYPGESYADSLDNEEVSAEQVNECRQEQCTEHLYTKLTEHIYSLKLPTMFDSEQHTLLLTPVYIWDFTWGRKWESDSIGIYFFNPVEVDYDILPESEFLPEPEPEPEPEPGPEFTYPLGDANKDYLVTAVDVVLMLKHIAGWQNLTIDTSLADMNSDGKIDLTDATRALKRIAGWSIYI